LRSAPFCSAKDRFLLFSFWVLSLELKTKTKTKNSKQQTANKQIFPSELPGFSSDLIFQTRARK